jgi:hypothetical protein
VIVHQRLANPVLLLGLVGVVWGLENLVRRRVSPGLRSYLWLTWFVIVIEAVVGLVLVAGGHRPVEGIHWFYGAALLLSAPVAWSFRGRSADARREALALTGGSLAIFLFAIRATGTG